MSCIVVETLPVDINFYAYFHGDVAIIHQASHVYFHTNQALRQKGVPEAEVDQATRSVFQDDRGDEDQASHGLSEASMDHLFAQASKQWLRGSSLPLEKRRARIVRWLQYRGFSWGVTNSIIRKLEAQHPP